MQSEREGMGADGGKSKMQLGQTSKFSVLDPAGSKVKHVIQPVDEAGGEFVFV